MQITFSLPQLIAQAIDDTPVGAGLRFCVIKLVAQLSSLVLQALHCTGGRIRDAVERPLLIASPVAICLARGFRVLGALAAAATMAAAARRTVTAVVAAVLRAPAAAAAAAVGPLFEGRGWRCGYNAAY
jgi:hypothetical protein